MPALPKPSRIKALEGNRKKLGITEIRVDPAGKGNPRMAPQLSELEQQLWSDTVRSLPDGLLSGADDGVLERFVVAWARFRDARLQLAATGLIVRSPQGPVRNPLIAICNAASDQMNRAGGELGLSPIARARLSSPGTAADDPMSLLLGDDEDGAWSTGKRGKYAN